MASTPGLTYGPLDPDNTSELTSRLGVHNKADRLLQRHASNWPVELVNALSRPLDEERTATLDLDEVEDALGNLSGRRAFFKTDDELEDAAVRGTSDRDRVVSVVFRKPSGRSAYGVIPYEDLDASIRAYDAKKARLEGGGAPVLLGASSDSSEREVALEAAAQDAESRARDAEARHEELLERVEALENPEPWDGYDELNAPDVVDAIKEGGIQEYGRAGLERIKTYEEGRERPRSTVVSAVEDALNAQNPAE